MLHEEIKTAVPEGGFLLYDPRLLQTADFIVLKEEPHRHVCLLRVKQHRYTVPIYGNNAIGGRPLRCRIMFHKADNSARQKKFPETPRVGKMGLDDFTVQFTLNGESVKPPEKYPLHQIREKTHTSYLPSKSLAFYEISRYIATK